MSLVDAFKANTFNTVSLSSSINKLPFQPSRIGKMGLFENKGIRNRTLILEEISGVLALLPTAAWGAPGVLGTSVKRNARSFTCLHIPHDDILMAGDVQDVRLFGSEDSEEGVVQAVNDKLTLMRQRHEVTLEHLRAGALKGNILDSDGSTVLFNLFSEFGISETTEAFLLASETDTAREHCLEVLRAVETALGGLVFDHVHCFAGKTWFEKFIKNADVSGGYDRWQQGEFHRNDPRAGFNFGGIIFEEYRGSIGGVDFIPDAEARFFPVGVPGLFKTFFAPADFIEAVNTVGLPIYAKQQVMEFDRGIKLHTQSNPLPMCTIPGVLIKGSTD